MSDLCFWCDSSDVADAETKPFGIQRIAQDLHKFSVSLDVLKAAIGKVSPDFLADLRKSNRLKELVIAIGSTLNFILR